MALDIKHTVYYSPPAGIVGSGAAVTFSASTTTPIATWTWARPVRIIRWGAIITTAATDNSTSTLKFTGNLWYQANVNTNQVAGATTTITSATGYNSSNMPAFYSDTAGGSLTVPNALLTGTGGLAIGSVIYHNVNPQAATSNYYPANPEITISSTGALSVTSGGGLDTQLVIYPGYTFAIMSTTVPNTAGAGVMFVEVEEQAFVAPYNNNQLAVTGVPAAALPLPSDPQGSLNPTASTVHANASGILGYTS